MGVVYKARNSSTLGLFLVRLWDENAAILVGESAPRRIPESDISLLCSWLGNPVIILDKIKIGATKEPLEKFEEYKLFVESTDRFSDRRQQISNTYLTVNSIIIGAIAFLVKDAVLDTYLRSIVIIVILLVGIVVCDVWKQIIYKS